MSQPPLPLVKPPKSLLRLVGRAIADFRMIGDGDRILLGVSGGKDSLSLLHILLHLQTYAPVRFELMVLTVDPQVPGFDPGPLRAYYDRLGVPWIYERQPLLDQAKQHMDGDSFCAYCSRMKRGIMYRVCREQGCNVLALAQHLDDLAESLLMSLFHGGQLRTMKAHYLNREGDVRIIRPLVYCRERQSAAHAERAALPVVPDSCPACFSMPTRREHMKRLLAREEVGHPHLFANILHAIKPIMTEGEQPMPGIQADRRHHLE
ncbi:MAG: tRNA 2-thiocytidine biosynthesis protein TtcA [Sphingobacteriia bacterium]|nr:tRNA 2-thiocytidine biosynthesis protein TtcA [Sphingobacteriia bacterium]NCC38645.1 tRNA 2-thiocytidine biosynthesis protein TtcA [Gammaproteobacteria bacterium]